MTQDMENEESLTMALEPEGKRLSRAEFQGLGDMPPELEWFANLDNPRTRRAYRLDVQEFTTFAGVQRPEEMRQVTRAHLIAWRKDLERRAWPRAPSGASWPRSPPCLTTSARSTPSAITRCAGSNARKRRGMRAKPPRWATARPGRCWKRPRTTPSKANGTGPSSRRSSTTACGARNC